MRVVNYLLIILALPVVFVCCTGLAGKGGADVVPLDESAVREVVRRLERGFRLGDMDTIRSCLAENFSLSVATWPAARRYMEPVLEKGLVKGVSFVALTDTSEGNRRLVRLKVEANGGVHETLAAVDGGHKIVFVDYFDRLYGHSRYDSSVCKVAVPFELQDDHIILSVRLNGSPVVLRLLFDTGADGMALRGGLADSLGLQVSHRQEANVVGGKVQVVVSAGNTVHLTDNFSLKSQSIALFPTIRHGLDGVIGLNLALGHVVGVNFDER
ncbi:MAG: aspartyl protease family protein, partial [Prevotellaceae bacterium]|nr:aspartyl protease family protein [Prevotellaceae bacterium]